MKNYVREYEEVFTGSKLVKKKCDLDKVSVHGEYPDSVERYRKLMADTLSDFQSNFFDSLVKTVWLTQKFTYEDRHRSKPRANGPRLDRAFGVFMRAFVGYDNRFMMNNPGPGGKIASYFEDFFPNFAEGNPFEEEFLYPYKHMTLECLVVVYQMDERIELLERGEAKGMSYTEFLDYVLNYMLCFNDEFGDKYLFTFSHVFMPYIKNNHKSK